MIGSCVEYSLLETSRVSGTDRNFHVFDILRNDAPDSLLKELGLENLPEKQKSELTAKHVVKLDRHSHIVCSH